MRPKTKMPSNKTEANIPDTGELKTSEQLSPQAAISGQFWSSRFHVYPRANASIIDAKVFKSVQEFWKRDPIGATHEALFSTGLAHEHKICF